MSRPKRIHKNQKNKPCAVKSNTHMKNVLWTLAGLSLFVAGSAGAETVSDFQGLQQSVLNQDVSEIALENDIVLDSRLQGSTPVKRSLHIDGNGHTISGAHPAFWFADMSAGTISIRNLTFDGMKSGSSDKYDRPIPFGPSVYFNMNDWKSEAVLEIGNGVSFLNNLAEYDSAGGAIRTAHGTVNIGNNVTFKNNMGGAGGALYSESFTTIGDDVVFEGNEARRGGALDVVDDYPDYASDPDYQAGRRKIKYVHIGKNALFKDNKAIFSFGGNGGAIEVQSGELTIDDGAVFSGNTSNDTGGALSLAYWSPQLQSKATLGTVSFLKNTATYGGAIITEGFLSLTGTANFEENSATNAGGALYNISTTIADADVLFSKNSSSIGGAILNNGSLSLKKKATFEENNATGAGGALYNVGETVADAHVLFSGNTSGTGGAILNEGTLTFHTTSQFSGNRASADGGAVYNVNALTFGNGTVFSDNAAEGDAGALYNDAAANDGTIVSRGDIHFNGGASFTGNTAAGRGGAIYNLYDVTLNPGAGQKILFRGNSDSSGMNAIYMGTGSRLDVTGAGTVIFDDPLAFEDATPVMKKSGDGTLLLNASMNGFLGEAEFDGGTTKVASDWNIKNVVTLSGGTLELPGFSFTAQNTQENIAGGSLTVAGGTLVTNTGQLFRNALGTAGSASGTGGLLQSVAEHFNFTSGLISFNDAKYNLVYAASAAGTLNATFDNNAGQGDKEIVFTGDLSTVVDPDIPLQPEPDPTTSVSGTVSVDDLNDNNVSNVVLGNVTISTASGTDTSTGKNLVVGASHTDDEQFRNAAAIEGSIGGRKLNLGTGGSGVSVVGGHYLTLVGSQPDTSLIEAGSDGKKPVDVYLSGTVSGQQSSGTLNLGTTAMPSGGTLVGNVRMAGSSVLNVRAGEFSITGETADSSTNQTVHGIDNDGGTLNIAEPAILNATVKQTAGETHVAGTLSSSSVTLGGGQFNVSGTAKAALLNASGGDIRVTGTLKADKLLASNGVNMTVGDGDAAGKLYVASASLDGGTVFLDPVWKGNDTIETASHGALKFNDDNVDGKLAVGRNSLLVLGESSTDRGVSLFNASGLQWGVDGITAALSIGAAQHVDPTKGAIVVNGSLGTVPTVASNTVTFANGSLLAVDVSGLNGIAAMNSENGTLEVAENASLLLGNATVGQHVITTGFADNTDVKGWDGEHLLSADQLIGLTLDKSENGTIKVHATVLDVTSALPGISMPGIITEIWQNGRNNTDSANAGIAFLSKAMDNRYIAAGDTVRTINGAAQIAVAAGVQASAIAASDSVNRALQDHLSISNNTHQPGAPSLHREGPDLWASMLYRDSDSSGIKAGRFNADYKNDFGGILAGADYTWKDTGFGGFRLGGALNVGKGEGKSRGDFNDTRNDYDTYGLSAYGSWNRGNANLMLDIGYMKGKNELKQTIPFALGGTLKADIDTQVWTIGAQGEYRFKTAAFDMTPHIGVRWSQLKTDAFKTHNTQGTVFSTDSDTQNIWQIPVGLTLSRDYVAKNGWTVKPKLDVSFVPASGDRHASTRIHVPGVGASDITRTEMMDSTSWNGSLGLDMQKDRLSVGIRAAYQKSADERSRGVMLTVNRQFD